MRILIAGASIALIAGIAAATAAPAGMLLPKDIQATFFNGQPFTAQTTSKVKYKMIFAADGTMTRQPLGKSGGKSEGTWKLSQDGYCTTWKGSKENCFRVIANGANKWAIMAGTTAVAYWSK